MGKARDGEGVGGVGRADVAHSLGGGVLRPDRPVGILGVVGDLVVGVGGILGIVEDDLVDRALFRADYQTLLVGVGHHAGDGHEGLGDHGLPIVADGLFRRNRFPGRLVQIFYRVGHGIPLHIPEGEGILSLVGNVNGQGVGLHHGEVALLIAVIEVGAALGLKGLGDARQTGAGGGRGDLGVRALELVGDGIFHQCVGAPLAVNLQILVDGHVGKVKGLLHAVVQVEPAHKGIAAVGRGLGSQVHQTAVGDRLVGVGVEFGPSLQRGLIQIELHRVGDGHPLGVEQDVGVRHGVLAQLVFRTGALGV